MNDMHVVRGHAAFLSVPDHTVPDMTRFHPWRSAREQHADTEIDCTRQLPDGITGQTDGRVIRLCRTLSQAQRRATLTHELIHQERGGVSTDPYLEAKEERIVDEIAARRLIPLDELVEALVWTRGLADAEAAWELWTDMHTLLVRIRTLTRDERRYIDVELERRG